jgi:hypothetical protein
MAQRAVTSNGGCNVRIPQMHRAGGVTGMVLCDWKRSSDPKVDLCDIGLLGHGSQFVGA